MNFLRKFLEKFRFLGFSKKRNFFDISFIKLKNLKGLKIGLFIGILALIVSSSGVLYVYSQSGASGSIGGSSLNKGLVAHWTLDNQDHDYNTENLLYDNNNINWTVGNLTTTISRSTIISNKKYQLTSGSNDGQFRFYVPVNKLSNGETYTMSFKYKIISGTKFRMNDWCDQALLNRVEEGDGYSDSYSAASGSRFEYNSTYRFMDIEISGNSVVEIWDVQLEKRDFATPFVSGVRESRVVDSTPYSNHGTNYGATPTTDRHGKVGGAMSFDGVSNRISISYPNPVNETSVVAWFKRSGSPAGGYHIITGGGNIEISIPDSSGQIRTGVTTNTQGRKVFNSGSGLNDGNWHQVAMTYDGVNLKSFIDGQITATNPVSGNLVGIAGEIGRFLSDSYVTNGSIDDVRIYNRALSDDEISLLYDSYELKTQISSINSGLVGHWTLSEEDYNSNTHQVTDKTPYSNNGTNLNATFVADRHGKAGGAMSFQGDGSYVSFPYNENFNIRKAITMSVWAKRTTGHDQPTDLHILSRYPSWFFYDSYSSGSIRAEVIIDGVRSAAKTTTLPFDNNWYNIVYTYNSETRTGTIYKNGVMVSATTLSGLNNYLIDSSFSSISSGNNSKGRGILLDDMRIYNRALSESEINLLYNSYNPQTGGDSLQKGLILDMPLTSTHTKTETAGAQIMTDRTPYGNDGQNAGAVIGSNYSTLNGTTYITIPDSDSIHNKAFGISNNFTISTWAHPLSWANWATIINQANGGSWSNTLNGLWASDSPTGFRCVMGSGVGGNPAGSSIGPAYNPGLNNWHHVVCIADGTNLKIYVNGIYRGQSAISSLTYPRTELFEPITIGRRSTGTGPSFNGYISNIKVYDRAISEDEVKSLYTQGAAMIGGIPNQE